MTTRHRTSIKRLAAALLLACAACSDRLPTAAESPAQLTEHLNCLMLLDNGEVRCTRESGRESSDVGGPQLALLQRLYDFTLRSSDAVYSATDSTLSAMVEVRVDMLWEPVGTADGQTVSGLKVFIESGPFVALYRDSADQSDPWFRNQTTGASGLGPASLLNPDGRASFTGADQPYMEYLEILHPGDWSAKKEWRFKVPPEALLIGFRAKVFTSTMSEQQVPAQAPDTIPEGFYDAPNVILDSPYFTISRRAVKDIVAIRFEATATRDERQAAVDLIGGTVVGGHRPSPIMEGSYFVLISDDGTGMLINAAIDTLSSLPTVATAQPELLWLPDEWLSYIEPTDAGSFARPWQTNPTLANGTNWGLEAVAAPHAWGCTTGSASTRISVLDAGFFSNADLMPNTTFAPSMDAYASLGYVDKTHGTSVASVLAARGDNQLGITGMMWDADLRLHDVSVSNDGDRHTAQVLFGLFNTPRPMRRLVEERLLEAVNSGADIINMSLSWRAYRDSTPELNPNRLISAAMNEFAHILRHAPNKPLLVVPAGNFGEDAYWSGVPYLAALLPDQVIVVGAVQAVGVETGVHYTPTSYNSSAGPQLIQIAAPGSSIGALDRSGSTTVSGTSFAAPYVAGIAGLLKSFDPRLNAPEIKELLIEGARRGGRRVPMSGSVYVANAYHSLRAAAERPGAPLCGNPVYQDTTGTVFTRRNANWTSAEVLFSMTDSLPEPLHGGRTIRFKGQAGYEWILNGPTPSWEFRSSIPAAPLNATNRSKQRHSHGRYMDPTADSTVSVSVVRISPTQERFDVSVSGSLVGQIYGPLSQRAQNVRQECTMWDLPGSPTTTCRQTWRTFTDSLTTNYTAAFSPSGDTVIVAISRDSTAQYAYDIIPFGTYAVRKWGSHRRSMETTLVYIPIHGGTIRTWEHPYRIEAIGVSENGRHLALQTRTRFWFNQVIDNQNSITQHNICRAVYTDRQGSELFTLPLQNLVNFGNTRACYPGTTFAP
jgi:subtilisin family serine protease